MVANDDTGGGNPERGRLAPEDAALLETLDPDLARQLFPDQVREAFTVTLRYPRLDGASGREAKRLASTAREHTTSRGKGTGAPEIHSTTFGLEQIEEFHELYHLAEGATGGAEVEVLLNRREVPLTRELWLPLLWSLRK